MAKPKKSNAQGKQKAVKPAVQETKTKAAHARSLAPKSAVRSIINEIISTKSAVSEVGQELSTATKRANDSGVNVPAARLAARIYAKAKQDAIKGRVLWEDLYYYLVECTDFEKMAPKGMFTPEESGQRRKDRDDETLPLKSDDERDAATMQ